MDETNLQYLEAVEEAAREVLARFRQTLDYGDPGGEELDHLEDTLVD